MIKLIFLFIAMLDCSLLWTQQPYGEISGMITDIENQAVPGATIKIVSTSDSALFQGDFSNVHGKFSLHHIPFGSYRLEVTGMGFKSYAAGPITLDTASASIYLPVIVLLTANATSLNEVTIVAKRPLIEQEVDRTIVHVDAMIGAATGNTLDVLEKTPGVTIDLNGDIGLNGKSGALVLIDGRATHMSGQDLAAYLKSLPGGILDRIELIDNPSSKYDAGGSAVINIRLKKNKTLGLTGNLSNSWNQGATSRSYQVLNLNLNLKKVNIFGNLGYNTDANKNTETSGRDFFETSGRLISSYNLDNEMVYHAHGLVTRLGVDYSISSKTVIGIQGNFQNRFRNEITRYQTTVNTYPSLPSALISGLIDGDFDWKNQGVNLNFQHKVNEKGHEVTGDLNFITYASPGSQEFKFSSNSTGSDFKYELYNGTKIYNLKVDYISPLAHGAGLEMGLKSSVVTNENNSRYFDKLVDHVTENFALSNHFIFDEHINAAYINARKSWARFSLQAGLRLENTRLKGHQLGNVIIEESAFAQNFTDLFPTFFGNYKLNKKGSKSLGLSFASRINRPNYQQFNPFLAYRDNYSYEQGNIDLMPQYMYRLEVKYQHNQWLSAGLSYNRARDLIFSSYEIKDNIYIYRPLNFGKGRMWLFNSNFNFKPISWWSANLNIQGAYLTVSGDIYGRVLTTNTPAAKINFQNMIQLPSGWSAECSLYYGTKDNQGQSFIAPRYRVNTALQKKVLKDKGALKLTMEDFFHSWIQNETLIPTKSNTTVRRISSDTQRLGLAFTYRFGNDRFLRKRKHTDNAAENEINRTN